MRHLLILSALLAAAAISPAATVINFNDGSNGASIGGFYAAQGVNFSNARWDNFGCVGVCPDAGLQLVAISGDAFQPKAANPIVLTFTTAVSAVSIYGYNVGGNGARMVAYDALVGGNILGTFTDTTVSSGFGVDNNPLLAIVASGIYRVELFQPFATETEGMLWDVLTFEPEASGNVPEPSTVILSGLGLAAVAMARRKR